MTDFTNSTSFIPKRNPLKKEKINTERHVFLGTLVIKIIFLTVFIAAVVVFAYETKLKSDFNDEVVALDKAISVFNEADMVRVLDTDLRLKQAKQRLEHTASIVTLLEAFEKSIINSSEVTQLSLERVDDLSFKVESEMKADSFDSILFQRSILEKNDTLSISKIEDMTLVNVPPEDGGVAEMTPLNNDFYVSFKVLLAADASKIPHKLVPLNEFDTNIPDVIQPPIEESSIKALEDSENIVTEVNQQDL